MCNYFSVICVKRSRQLALIATWKQVSTQDFCFLQSNRDPAPLLLAGKVDTGWKHSPPLFPPQSCSFLSLINRDYASPGPPGSALPLVRADLCRFAMTWHRAAPDRAPLPATLPLCCQSAKLKYAMFAAVSAFPPAPLCFSSGDRPRRAVCCRPPHLPVCRGRSVFLRSYTSSHAALCMVGLFLHWSGSVCLHHIPGLRFHPAGQFQPESDLSVVHPVKTTADGSFISHSVSHRFKGGRFRRELQPSGSEEQVYYKVNYKGRSLTFNLTVNHHLVSSGYILERRNGGTNRTDHPLSEGNSCHLLGSVESSDGRGTAAVSTCRGLVRGQESYALKKQKTVFPSP